jgi:hypothetical protein
MKSKRGSDFDIESEDFHPEVHVTVKTELTVSYVFAVLYTLQIHTEFHL